MSHDHHRDHRRSTARRPEPGSPIIETVGPHQDLRRHGLPRRRRARTSSVGAGEVFGLLGPNGAGKTTTVGVLTTRVIPSGGQAFVGGIDVVRHPTLVKQLIGVVSQQNTLDRQLTPWENLYFHGRLFGMGATRVPADGGRAPREVPADTVRQGVGLRPLRGHGPAAHGGARHLPSAGRALPRRTDRRPRPPGAPCIVGAARRAQRRGPDHHAHHALHGGGGQALRPCCDHGPRQDPRPRYTV